jgi:protein-S-isoprenylcysteine O-methyltransferase Ste14
LFGVAVLLWCVRDFYVVGKGTRAPWDPPKNLVIVGLYRYVRNAMYIGVLSTVFGWSIIAGSPLMATYTATVAIAFHLRIIFYEEPTLARKFGDEWTRYRKSVNRWWPRLLPDNNAK